ncbi:hypothetical protein Tco_0200214 [Tanacetum coccineum]
MKDLGPAKQIIGIRIFRDRGAKKLHISQEQYIEKVLCRFNMDKAKVLDVIANGEYKAGGLAHAVGVVVVSCHPEMPLKIGMFELNSSWMDNASDMFAKAVAREQCVKSCEEKKITEKKEIFGVRYHPNHLQLVFLSITGIAVGSSRIPECRFTDIERKVLTVGILILRPGSLFS